MCQYRWVLSPPPQKKDIEVRGIKNSLSRLPNLIFHQCRCYMIQKGSTASNSVLRLNRSICTRIQYSPVD